MSGSHDPEYIVELFAAFGPVTVRRMFSGAGIFAGGVMFALTVQGVIYLKADASTAPEFEREGLAPFTYTRKGGRPTALSYWRMPDRLYDDPDELSRWARQAHTVALSSAVAPKKKRRARSPPERLRRKK